MLTYRPSVLVRERDVANHSSLLRYSSSRSWVARGCCRSLFNHRVPAACDVGCPRRSNPVSSVFACSMVRVGASSMLNEHTAKSLMEWRSPHVACVERATKVLRACLVPHHFGVRPRPCPCFPPTHCPLPIARRAVYENPWQCVKRGDGNLVAEHVVEAVRHRVDIAMMCVGWRGGRRPVRQRHFCVCPSDTESVLRSR